MDKATREAVEKLRLAITEKQAAMEAYGRAERSGLVRWMVASTGAEVSTFVRATSPLEDATHDFSVSPSGEGIPTPEKLERRLRQSTLLMRVEDLFGSAGNSSENPGPLPLDALNRFQYQESEKWSGIAVLYFRPVLTPATSEQRGSSRDCPYRNALILVLPSKTDQIQWLGKLYKELRRPIITSPDDELPNDIGAWREALLEYVRAIWPSSGALTDASQGRFTEIIARCLRGGFPLKSTLNAQHEAVAANDGPS